MITGLLANRLQNEKTLPAVIMSALEGLEGKDLMAIKPGRYEIDGDKLFFLVQDAALCHADGRRPEIHRSYADIQIPVSGSERYGVALPQSNVQSTEDLLDTRDVAFYPTPANEFFMDLHPGEFAVFFPGELHRPCVATNEPTSIRKVVVKVHVSLLGL